MKLFVACLENANFSSEVRRGQPFTSIRFSVKFGRSDFLYRHLYHTRQNGLVYGIPDDLNVKRIKKRFYCRKLFASRVIRKNATEYTTVRAIRVVFIVLGKIPIRSLKHSSRDTLKRKNKCT